MFQEHWSLSVVLPGTSVRTVELKVFTYLPEPSQKEK
jgi:hypothetical protein